MTPPSCDGKANPNYPPKTPREHFLQSFWPVDACSCTVLATQNRIHFMRLPNHVSRPSQMKFCFLALFCIGCSPDGAKIPIEAIPVNSANTSLPVSSTSSNASTPITPAGSTAPTTSAATSVVDSPIPVAKSPEATPKSIGNLNPLRPQTECEAYMARQKKNPTRGCPCSCKENGSLTCAPCVRRNGPDSLDELLAK